MRPSKFTKRNSRTPVISKLISFLAISVTTAIAAPDVARFAGDLKVDGIHFTEDNRVQTKASPWGYGAQNRIDFGITEGNVGIGTLLPNEQLELTANLRLPPTTATTGIIKSGINTLLHIFGLNNLFLGVDAGNLTMSGSSNTGIGRGAVIRNSVGNFNTAVGDITLFSNYSGSYNTALGANVLSSNTTGSSNTASGFAALNNNTTSSDNTAHGVSSLYYNTTGSYNTAIGSKSLYANTTGMLNTASGYLALGANTIGAFNSASGANALRLNTTGTFNTSVGNNSLYSNSTGTENSAYGFQALQANTTGNGNTAVGYRAGGVSPNLNSTGSFNTFLGHNSGLGTTTPVNNATAIGANATVSSSNSLALGGVGANAVKVGIGTAAPSETLDVVGAARINDNDLYLRTGIDRFHGLGYYGSSKLFAGKNIDGPVLYGWVGGALGTNVNGTQKIILQWDGTSIQAGPGMTGTPIAFGSFDASGAKLSGSSNINCTISGNIYFCPIDGEDYNPGKYIVNVTAVGGGAYFCSTDWNKGNTLNVRIYSFSTATAAPPSLTAAPFHLVVYKP